AEDGIRDFHVTGVQTCALPISAAERAGTGSVRAVRAPSRWTRASAGRRLRPAPRRSAAAAPSPAGTARTAPRPAGLRLPARSLRSEERRVGKAWGTRWTRLYAI